MKSGVLDHRNPWISIWLRPGETMRDVLEGGRTRDVFIIAAIVGIQNALWAAQELSLGDHGPVRLILGFGAAVGAVSGVVWLLLTAGLLTWSGRWFGGSGGFRRLRAAVAWSAVPIAWALPLWIPKLLIAGDGLFRTLDAAAAVHPAITVLDALETAAQLWTLVLLVICVAEAHRMPLRRAFATVALVLVVLLLATVVLQQLAGFPAAGSPLETAYL
jgi:hypothetical protein